MKRRKRSAAEAREEALEAARGLLIAGGPKAITLTAVGNATGMTTPNLSHHFGSAAGLQTALMARMVADMYDMVAVADADLRSSNDVAGFVDRIFDVFSKNGGGQLAAWTEMSNNTPQFAVIGKAVGELIAIFSESFGKESAKSEKRAARLVLFVAICAFGDSVIGASMHGYVNRPDTDFREMVSKLLPILLDPHSDI